MAFSKSMQNAVLQTVILHVANMIISHHLWSSTEELITNNDLYYQITNATEFKKNATSAVNLNGTSLPVAVNATSLSNSTASNGTSVTSNNEKESFYKKELPRDIALVIIVTILEYYWQIWLERLLPARPRSNVLQEKDSLEDDDAREDLIVKKWIAQGKIRRASLSLWNTALKWILDVGLGGFWIVCFNYVGEELLKWEKGSALLANSSKWELGFRYFFSFMDGRVLASLIAFIIVPADKRIVFVAGMQLAASTFFGVFANTIVPWLLTTEFAKDTVGKISEGIRNGTQPSPFGPPSLRLGDEL